MTALARLRERWGGGIRPEVAIQRNFIERRDGEGEGDGWSVHFEGFGLSGCLYIGRTPPRSTTIVIDSDDHLPRVSASGVPLTRRRT